MAAYSMDLRLRVLCDADAGLPSAALAEKHSVGRAWVDRRKQRCRETGESAPRKQTRWRTPILHAQLAQLAALIREQPDRTLAELQEALRTPASLPTLDPTRLVFLDESGVRTNLVRRYGRGLDGARVTDRAPDGRWHTTTFLAGLRVTGLTAPAVFDGPIDGASFRTHVEQVLVPTLAPGDIVVIHGQPGVSQESDGPPRH